MKRYAGILGVIALAGIAFVAGAESSAQRAPGGNAFPGAHPAGAVEEIFAMPAAYTGRGVIGDPRRFADKRELLFVPEHFGNLVSVTAHGEDAVLWFRDEGGSLRNIPLTQVASRTLCLERQPSEVSDIKH